MADKHGKLAQGKLEHDLKACGSCERTNPPIRIYLDQQNGLEILDNHTVCQGQTWLFSVGLLAHNPRYKGRVPYVMRACSSHANYHLHEWHPLRPFSKNEKVSSFGVLDSLEEADKAYRHSQSYIPEEGIKRWWQEWKDI